MLKSILFLMGGVVLATSVPAAAQDVVMRRPMPRSGVGTGSVPDGSVDPSTPGTPVVSIPQVQCGEGESALINSAAWVSTGWIGGGSVPGSEDMSCREETKSFTCQVEAYCLLPGQRPNYEGDALYVDVDDSVCENFDGFVPTVDPDGGLPSYELPPM